MSAAATAPRDPRSGSGLAHMRVERAADEVESRSGVRRAGFQEGRHLVAVPLAPPRRVEPQQPVPDARPSTSMPSDASARDQRRDQARLPERDGQRSEGDPPRVDEQYAGRVHLDRIPIQPARCRPEELTRGLDPEAVVPRLVAGAVEPEVLDARVRAAAQVRAALRHRADVEGRALARLVATRRSSRRDSDRR